MLAQVPSFGLNHRGSTDFLAYPVPEACRHVLGTGVPRCLGVASSAIRHRSTAMRPQYSHHTGHVTRVRPLYLPELVFGPRNILVLLMIPFRGPWAAPTPPRPHHLSSAGWTPYNPSHCRCSHGSMRCLAYQAFSQPIPVARAQGKELIHLTRRVT